MERKYVKIPFDVEMAKRIQNGECEGKIVTRDDKSVRIVCFDAKQDDPVVALISYDNAERVKSYAKDGIVFEAGTSPIDLMLEAPEYMTFKDGDVIAYDEYPDIFFVIGGRSSLSDETPNYYIKYNKGDLSFGLESSFCRLKDSRLATEEERQKLINALKSSKEPQAKVYLKRFFSIEEKPECEFKPFDKVLVRDLFFKVWYNDIFSFVGKNGKYMCIGNVWDECIPYNEQTEHLLGTTENYE